MRGKAGVSSESPMLQTGTITLSRVANQAAVTGLSTNRQISGGLFVHCARSYDNNFELNGISVSDVQSSANTSGANPIPNPDAIQEFKVQTGLYNAPMDAMPAPTFSLLTKSGAIPTMAACLSFYEIVC